MGMFTCGGSAIINAVRHSKLIRLLSLLLQSLKKLSLLDSRAESKFILYKSSKRLKRKFRLTYTMLNNRLLRLFYWIPMSKKELYFA